MKVHYLAEEKYKFNLQNLELAKWSRMMQVTAKSANIEENSLKQILEKMNDKLNAIINDYNFPNRKVTEEEKRQNMTREEKVNFLEEVGQYKFNSINEIFSMLKSQDKKR